MEAESLSVLYKLFPILNAGALITLIGLILRHRIATRKTDIEARKVDIEQDDFDRKGWKELIGTLTEQVERLSRQVGDLQTENGQLRSEVRELHSTLEGMRRQNLQEGSSAAKAVLAALPPENIPPATRDALRRVRGDK